MGTSGFILFPGKEPEQIFKSSADQGVIVEESPLKRGHGDAKVCLDNRLRNEKLREPMGFLQRICQC
jgi:hypothetical protein